MKQHPFIAMKLKVGDAVWVRATIKDLSTPNTLGWANGMLRVAVVTHGLNQDPGDPQIISTDVANVRREQELRRQYNENQEDDTQPEMTFGQWKAIVRAASTHSSAARRKRGKKGIR